MSADGTYQHRDFSFCNADLSDIAVGTRIQHLLPFEGDAPEAGRGADTGNAGPHSATARWDDNGLPQLSH